MGDDRVGHAVAVRIHEQLGAILQRPAGKYLSFRGSGILGTENQVPVAGLLGGEQRIFHDETPGNDAVRRGFPGISLDQSIHGQIDVEVGQFQRRILQFHDLRFKVKICNLRIFRRRFFNHDDLISGFFRKRKRRHGQQQRDEQCERSLDVTLHVLFLPNFIHCIAVERSSH